MCGLLDIHFSQVRCAPIVWPLAHSCLCAMSRHQVDSCEDALMKSLHTEGYGVKKIAAMLRRSTDTVSKHVFKKNTKRVVQSKGRPKVITETVFKRMQKVYQKLLKESHPYEVTVAMLKGRLGLACSEKTISRAFWDHGIHFKPLYEKPALGRDDIAARLVWATANQHRSPAQWNRYVHAVIDNKVFPVYASGKFRTMAARRRVRGAYRGRARNLSDGYVKPKATLKQNTGCKSVMVACALGAGKVLMWHVVQGQWNGKAAAAMYKGPLQRSLKRAYPEHKGAWRVLEDNDPSGYKSNLGKAAKVDSGITPMSLPTRSPDLNPLDFSFWAAVNRKMREDERGWPVSKRESRSSFITRLRKTAQGMPKEYVDKIIGAMAGRCRQIVAAKGGHIAEGH